jgi:hypothetical protein
MSNSLHERGLPPWLFTPRMAVISGVGFAFVVLMIGSAVSFVGGAFDRTNLNSAPTCFMIERPIRVGTGTLDQKSFDARRIDGERLQNIAKVEATEAACQVGDCPAAAREKYRSAIKTYMMSRTRAASQFMYLYGEGGLNYARWIYEDDADRAIIKGLRQRYGAGLFDIKSMDNGGHDYIASTRMLLFGNEQAFRPCLAN